MTQTPYCDSSVSTLHGDISQKLTEKLQCQEAELLKMKELEKELAEKKNEIEQLQNELTYLKEVSDAVLTLDNISATIGLLGFLPIYYHL